MKRQLLAGSPLQRTPVPTHTTRRCHAGCATTGTSGHWSSQKVLQPHLSWTSSSCARTHRNPTRKVPGVCGPGPLVEWVLEELVAFADCLNNPTASWSPGATASPSNASRAEDNSPIVAKTRTHSALCSTVSARFRDLLDLTTISEES